MILRSTSSTFLGGGVTSTVHDLLMDLIYPLVLFTFLGSDFNKGRISFLPEEPHFGFTAHNSHEVPH